MRAVNRATNTFTFSHPDAGGLRAVWASAPPTSFNRCIGIRMNAFHRREGSLFCEEVSLETLAEQYGTPLYVYSRAAITEAFLAYQGALAGREHLICYAVKANSNLAVLNVLARLGAGFDIVSGGELQRVLKAGGDPGKVVFSGVAKQRHEIRRALEVGVHCFNVESEQELESIQEEALAM